MTCCFVDCFCFDDNKYGCMRTVSLSMSTIIWSQNSFSIITEDRFRHSSTIVTRWHCSLVFKFWLASKNSRHEINAAWSLILRKAYLSTAYHRRFKNCDKERGACVSFVITGSNLRWCTELKYNCRRNASDEHRNKYYAAIESFGHFSPKIVELFPLQWNLTTKKGRRFQKCP